MKFIAVDIDRVKEVMAMNKRGEFPEEIIEIIEEKEGVKKELDYLNVVGQDDLTRFDNKKKKKSVYTMTAKFWEELYKTKKMITIEEKLEISFNANFLIDARSLNKLTLFKFLLIRLKTIFQLWYLMVFLMI